MPRSTAASRTRSGVSACLDRASFAFIRHPHGGWSSAFPSIPQVSLITKGILRVGSGRCWRKSACAKRRATFSVERRGFSAPSAANWSAWRPMERRPANAGHFLYVPLPVSTAFEWLSTAAELETFWKLLGNLPACPPEVETFCKHLGNAPNPNCLGGQMSDTPSILSARLTQ
jgi:hypothetical protein